MMKKGLGRELAQSAISAVIILMGLAIFWVATKFDWVLSSFGGNWLPFVIGFATDMVRRVITNLLFGRYNRRHEDEEGK